jgi:hypothetical protein
VEINLEIKRTLVAWWKEKRIYILFSLLKFFLEIYYFIDGSWGRYTQLQYTTQHYI